MHALDAKQLCQLCRKRIEEWTIEPSMRYLAGCGCFGYAVRGHSTSRCRNDVAESCGGPVPLGALHSGDLVKTRNLDFESILPRTFPSIMAAHTFQYQPLCFQSKFGLNLAPQLCAVSGEFESWILENR